MKEYTELVNEQINSGRIMKGNRGSNSMYEFETHFQPNPGFYSLIIALERKMDKKGELGLRRNADVDIYDLVVKNVEGTFDDGEILFSKTFIRFTAAGKYFYVSNVSDALKIEEKRDFRWSRNSGRNPRVRLIASEGLVEKLKSNRGFKNAKPEDLSVYKVPGYGYEIKNTSLKSEPSLTYRF